ncbi:ATP-binding cassette domain-containing protein [Umezakia ovalisporum]|uniref:ATP-binding cassette domain-containing protein n=2 Tax=Umezakia ovalisporum TaxID=75695 RepID=A0AA43GYG6_9CYAN|nr:ATP-binding cassette domain-containing protein [Umezakia ovalisporum]MDH6055421.1 ATP-binding cassette domain-containing protein [Umezakia ovalisporum FSS-43]MDH6064159.1 ATP-binding cassette domain-containing protein [Umezakia ovalisporum FSS-62]MDH6069963.1 ATP-binding cassette domain-containing protein [Umezakia ovalisporum CobakiLakeA]MDH6075170.1 ATP-binding cassette domain-containing protein [Umezakia ovalisporum CS-1034]MDH6076616.1 ATP-binding cassette domain-containing protein [Ume
MTPTTRPYLVLTNQGQILPAFELSHSQHILGRDPQIADLLVPPDWSVISRCQATLLEVEGKYYIYDGDRRQPSSNRLFINNHLISHDLGYCLQDGDIIKIGQNFSILVTLEFRYSHSSSHNLKSFASISLKERSTILGRDPTANLQIIAPTISRKHAVIEYLNPGEYILYDCSTNGIFVNDIKINGKIRLNSGAIIKIPPYTLVLQGDELVTSDTGSHIRLDAKNIFKTIKTRNHTKVLLNQISLPIEPGQLVAFVGGSGAGKSTLMQTLLGIQPTTEGTVYINGENLRHKFNIYRNQIGYVPQSDILHKELKVVEALKYSAKLRLPPDADIDLIIEQTLSQIEMLASRDVFVKNLSGGQLKRVSIGVELLVDPKLFFLDEPTSGLDPGLDKKMMQLLRKLANQGRTIILVTHATGNINLCDRIAFLGQGGNLCYFGSFEDACIFFNLEKCDFADVYIKLDNQEVVMTTAEQFKRSPYQTQYIDQRLGINASKIIKARPRQVQASLGYQTLILAQRHLQLIVRDRINLIISLITAPIAILLINLAIADQEPLILGSEADPGVAPLAQTVVFVFTCTAIWVGLASSLQEIVKEKDIYLRERLVNLSFFAYLSAKVLVLSGIACLQTTIMVTAILMSFAVPKSLTIPWFWGVSITSFLTLLSCLCLGLTVSASVKNSTQANSALVMLLLPQIILSGVLFQTQGISKYLSWLTISRWSVGAYGSLVNINALVPEPTLLPKGTTIAPPFVITDVYDPSWYNLGLNWGLLLLHSFVYVIVTLIIQKRKDII